MRAAAASPAGRPSSSALDAPEHGVVRVVVLVLQLGRNLGRPPLRAGSKSGALAGRRWPGARPQASVGRTFSSTSSWPSSPSLVIFHSTCRAARLSNPDLRSHRARQRGPPARRTSMRSPTLTSGMASSAARFDIVGWLRLTHTAGTGGTTRGKVRSNCDGVIVNSNSNFATVQRQAAGGRHHLRSRAGLRSPGAGRAAVVRQPRRQPRRQASRG